MSCVDESNIFKDKGNSAFKNEKWVEAVEFYTKAIEVGEKSSELSVFYKNRAAAYLKLKSFENAIVDCTLALEICPNDVKALFRRSQAYEGLDKYEESYKDALSLLKLDPSNKAVQPILRRLHEIVQERSLKTTQTSTKVKQMCQILFDQTDTEKRIKALNNILVISRDNFGADLLYKENIIQKFASLIKTEKCEEICINVIRTVDEICKNSVERTKSVIIELGVPWFLHVLDSKNPERVHSAQCCLQTILNTFSGMENKHESKPKPEMCKIYEKEIDTLLTCLTFSITEPTISGFARDAIIEILTRNIHYNALNWAERLVEIRGVHRLLAVCSELEEYKYESAMEITKSSRTLAAVCLARIYENMYYDEAREKFMKQVDEYINDKLLSPDHESKVRVIVTITSLLLGPLDVGNIIISREGILQMILAMATTEDTLHQKIACECIIAASSKKDKVKIITSHGVDILKRLYHSKDDGIRVRALVGLCKLGSSGGLDASIRPFSDGANIKLAEACRKFLVKPGNDYDIRKWAAQGLSYLTLDADIKEKLVEDKQAIQALMELAISKDQSIIYGIITIFVNLCNAYEKQEILPEMLELAKFAKQHVPQEHELDDPDFVNKRIRILCNEGITTALVALSKTESNNSKELIARLFNALCSIQELRGTIVQDGGVKALLKLSINGTLKGKRQAAQALARICISINPEIALPGQRHLEVIRPLISLLQPECSALENFESLLALCNLAQMNETVRKHILKEGGISMIESYIMEDHEMLKRAAVQCICNLAMSEDFVKMHEGNNDRIKLLALLCEEEDEETAKAASGALAMITSISKKCCKKIFECQNWLRILHTLIANPSPDVQHRGIVIILNVINSEKCNAQKLLETDVLELLTSLSKLPDDSRSKAREVAILCLQAAERYQIIEKSDNIEIPDIFKEANVENDFAD